jgi:DsbC/DsbD-like thiol-disulfide interchange protein
MSKVVQGTWRAAFGLAAGLALASPASAQEPSLASDWVKEQTAQVRLVAGGASLPGRAGSLYAGLQLTLQDGWKTYWRNPGYSGVPPNLDLQGSDNIAEARVLYPAPVRFKDRDGDTIGYKHSVVFPIAITPKDPAKPVRLNVTAELGICRDVCIPVQPKLVMSLPPGASSAPGGAALSEALAKVPLPNAAGPGDPRLSNVKIDLTGSKPSIVIDATFPGDPSKADIFLEAPGGTWIPLPKAAGAGSEGTRRFHVDLTDGADLADLKGRDIRVTLVGSKGQAEASFNLH